jgi:uncharacterized Zn-binding protein involved in type VI secretion
MATKRIACLGDPGRYPLTSPTHSGTITSAGQTSTKVGGVLVATAAGEFTCSVHGKQTLTAITTKSKIGGSLIITDGATAACGCIIVPPDRSVYVE